MDRVAARARAIAPAAPANRIARPLSGRAAVAAALTFAVGSVSGVAVAYWTATSTGRGAAYTASAALVTDLVTEEEPTIGLVPGGSADIVVKVTNRGTAAVSVAGLRLGATTVDGSHPDCPPSTVSTNTDRTNSALRAYLSALAPIRPSETRTLGLPNAATMAPTAPTGCQGATFRFAVSVVSA